MSITQIKLKQEYKWLFNDDVCQTNSKAVASMLALKSFKDDARRNWKGRLFDNMAFILKRKLHLKLSSITFFRRELNGTFLEPARILFGGVVMGG